MSEPPTHPILFSGPLGFAQCEARLRVVAQSVGHGAHICGGGHMTRGLLVDAFAGGGGASTGIAQALGRPVDIAINHDPEAVALHTANHHDTRHFCEDVFAVDPVRACAGRPVDLFWCSPDCKHHSRAKGGKPVDKHIRGLAWVAVRWAKAVRPRVIILENVTEFETWGPLGPDQRPDKARAGLTFRRFVGNLRAVGYTVEWRALRACDYGAPTTRERLVLIARCDGAPIMWPRPTHGPRTTHPYRIGADCIDWMLPVPSMFTRQTPLVPNTLARIARGIRRFVIEAEHPYSVPAPWTWGADDHRADVHNFLTRYGVPQSVPTSCVTDQCTVRAFLIAYYGNERDGGALTDPMRTVVSKDRFALVTVHGAPYRIADIGMRMLTARELYRAQGFPDSYQITIPVGGKMLSTTAQKRMAGNAVCPPLARAIVAANLGTEYAEVAA